MSEEDEIQNDFKMSLGEFVDIIGTNVHSSQPGGKVGKGPVPPH